MVPESKHPAFDEWTSLISLRILNVLFFCVFPRSCSVACIIPISTKSLFPTWMTRISFMLIQMLMPESSLFILNPQIPDLTVGCFQASLEDSSAGEASWLQPSGGAGFSGWEPEAVFSFCLLVLPGKILAFLPVGCTLGCSDHQHRGLSSKSPRSHSCSPLCILRWCPEPLGLSISEKENFQLYSSRCQGKAKDPDPLRTVCLQFLSSFQCAVAQGITEPQAFGVQLWVVHLAVKHSTGKASLPSALHPPKQNRQLKLRTVPLCMCLIHVFISFYCCSESLIRV